MLVLNTVASVFALSSLVAGLPTTGSGLKSSVFEKLIGPPTGWVADQDAKVDKDASMIKLRIHLVQQDMQDFHDLAIKVLPHRNLCILRRGIHIRGLAGGRALPVSLSLGNSRKEICSC